jgi:hypothetical protein
MARVALLEHMAASRTELVEKNRALALPAPRTYTHASTASRISSIASALGDAPHVALLLALIAGGIVLGPRRTLTIASRSGAAAWISRNVRQLVKP